jgi:hypothetical protein
MFTLLCCVGDERKRACIYTHKGLANMLLKDMGKEIRQFIFVSPNLPYRKEFCYGVSDVTRGT